MKMKKRCILEKRDIKITLPKKNLKWEPINIQALKGPFELKHGQGPFVGKKNHAIIEKS